MSDESPAVEFPKDQWPRLTAALADGGMDAALRILDEPTDPLDRRKLLMFATGQLAWQDWPGKNADDYVRAADWAIAECLAQAETEADEEARNRRIDLANIVSYNVSARLADCWDDDVFERTPERFQKGLDAALQCLRWREQLQKGAFPFSIAWWAEGMHRLSLGEADASVAGFTKSLDYACQAVRDNDEEPDPTVHFGVALGEGYLGIAEQHAGQGSGRARFDAAVAAFEVMATNPDKKGDAEMGLAQLRTVAARYPVR